MQTKRLFQPSIQILLTGSKLPTSTSIPDVKNYTYHVDAAIASAKRNDFTNAPSTFPQTSEDFDKSVDYSRTRNKTVYKLLRNKNNDLEIRRLGDVDPVDITSIDPKTSMIVGRGITEVNLNSERSLGILKGLGFDNPQQAISQVVLNRGINTESNAVRPLNLGDFAEARRLQDLSRVSSPLESDGNQVTLGMSSAAQSRLTVGYKKSGRRGLLAGRKCQQAGRSSKNKQWRSKFRIRLYR